MTTGMLSVGWTIQICLILAGLCAAFAMVFGVRTMTLALACFALSFVGMAMRGEPAALVAVAMGALMELRLNPMRRHRGLVEWLLVSVALCQVALSLLTTTIDIRFWIAQGLGASIHLLALIAAFAPQWWTPRMYSSGHPTYLPPGEL
jgi:hypothetical protein